MIIKSVKLVNFRNHKTYTLNCKDDVSLILGENGFGKTSILEAIYILMRGKSFRATDKDILKHDEDYYRVELEYKNGEKATVTYDGANKTFNIENKKTKRLPKKNKYPVVLFLPSDLNLISHSPGSRRDYFDRIFSEFNEDYNQAISKYQKALKQRNELLKNENINLDSIFPWDLMLAKYGTEINEYRGRYIKDLNQIISKLYYSITAKNDKIEIDYKTEIKNNSTQTYLNLIQENHQKDIYLKHTSFGVHRDDYIFKFNQKIAESTASRGETRSIILALKFAEANLIHQKTHLNPIILLDDVFSELDQKHRKCLIKNFKNNQIIITSVESI